MLAADVVHESARDPRARDRGPPAVRPGLSRRLALVIDRVVADDAGLVVSVEDYWPERYDPPTGRAHLVDRY